MDATAGLLIRALKFGSTRYRWFYFRLSIFSSFNVFSLLLIPSFDWYLSVYLLVRWCHRLSWTNVVVSSDLYLLYYWKQPFFFILVNPDRLVFLHPVLLPVVKMPLPWCFEMMRGRLAIYFNFSEVASRCLFA